MIDQESTLLQSWFDILQSSGYRLTNPRKALVEIMASAVKPLSALDLFDLGRQRCSTLGLVTVYRTLDKLEELHLIQKVHSQGGCHAYLRANQGHEHLLLCTVCHQSIFFSGDDLSALMNTVARDSGYKIQEHWLQLMGICPDCQKLEQRPSE